MYQQRAKMRQLSCFLLLLSLLFVDIDCLTDDGVVSIRPDVELSGQQLSQVMRYFDAKLEEVRREQKESEDRLTERISQLESDLAESTKTNEKRQVSSNSLNGALRTMLEHFKHNGENIEEPEFLKYDNNTAAAVTAKIGSVYTRWGRTVCDSDSALIYSGFSAGTYYTTVGGGSNYQCMPLDPEYSEYVPGGHNSVIGGVEYQTHSILKSVFDHNVPCARCYTSKSATMMIPGKRSCPSTWKVEYAGYLMTEHSTHHRSTYECVDSEPETITGGEGDLRGAHFYFVKADCDDVGSTGHCPPYNRDKPITCVVCSK